MTLEISPAAMTAAKSSVDTAGQAHQTAAKYPDVTLSEASTAQSALDDLGVSWGQRLGRDEDLVEAIGTAFLLVGRALQAADSDLKTHLASIDYTWEQQ